MLRARDEARIRRTVILSVFAVSVYLALDRLAGFVRELETGEDPSVVGLLARQGLIYATVAFGMIAAAHVLLKVIDRIQRRRREEAEAEAPLLPAPPDDPARRQRLEAYLRCDEWWARRSDTLARAGHRCEECRSLRELVVVHRS